MDETSGTTPMDPGPAEVPAAPEPPAPPAPPAPYAAPAAPMAPPAAAGMSGRPAPVTDTSKLLAALGYLIWPVALVAMLIDPYKDEKFVKFHAVQALALNLVTWIAAMIPYVGWVASIVVFVFLIIGLIKAFGSEYWEAPVVYGIVKGYIGGEE